FWIVIVVNDRWRCLSVDAIPRTELKIEFCSTGFRPHVKNDPVGQNVVPTQAPVGLHRGFQRLAADISSGRNSNLGEQHSVPFETDPFSADRTRYILHDRSVRSIAF